MTCVALSLTGSMAYVTRMRRFMPRPPLVSSTIRSGVTSVTTIAISPWRFWSRQRMVAVAPTPRELSLVGVQSVTRWSRNSAWLERSSSSSWTATWGRWIRTDVVAGCIRSPTLQRVGGNGAR